MSFKKPLDQLDIRLIELLQNNARLSNKELAAKSGLAPSSCFERIRKLREKGIFKGFHAQLDPDYLGTHIQAIVAIRLTRHEREVVSSFREHVITIKEVTNIYHMAGNNDFLIHVVVKDAVHLREFILNDITSRKEVAHVETAMIFEHLTKPQFPIYHNSESM